MCIHIDKLTVVAGLHNRTARCISRGCALYYFVVVTRYFYNYYIYHIDTSRTIGLSRCTNLSGHDDDNNIILYFIRQTTSNVYIRVLVAVNFPMDYCFYVRGP